jgi:hypothetical protein
MHGVLAKPLSFHAEQCCYANKRAEPGVPLGHGSDFAKYSTGGIGQTMSDRLYKIPLRPAVGTEVQECRLLCSSGQAAVITFVSPASRLGMATARASSVFFFSSNESHKQGR